MKRLVSQKTLAMRDLPGLAPDSSIHQKGEEVRIIHQVVDLGGAFERTTGNRHLYLCSSQLAIDTFPIPEEPNSVPIHFEGKRQPASVGPTGDGETGGADRSSDLRRSTKRSPASCSHSCCPTPSINRTGSSVRLS
jgi:hypothetical protein